MPKRSGPILILAFFCGWISGAASAFETKAQAAYVLDHGSGTVLLAKQADVAPASCLNVEIDDALVGLRSAP